MAIEDIAMKTQVHREIQLTDLSLCSLVGSHKGAEKYAVDFTIFIHFDMDGNIAQQSGSATLIWRIQLFFFLSAADTLFLFWAQVTMQPHQRHERQYTFARHPFFAVWFFGISGDVFVDNGLATSMELLSLLLGGDVAFEKEFGHDAKLAGMALVDIAADLRLATVL